MKQTRDPPAFYTRAEVMALFRCGRTKIDRLIASRELTSIKDRGRRLVEADSVRARIERLRKGESK
jgi:hypothetical protein